MPLFVIEFLLWFLVLLTVGTFILLFPITRRLGRIMEEWIALRRDSVPERATLSRIEDTLASMSHRLESVEQRMDLAGERQEFIETLLERNRLTGSSAD
jgi:hypothetical protein